MSARRKDIDWLRIGATWMLFAFHVGKVFDVAPFYHVKRHPPVPEIGLFTGFVHQWHMRLFFLLAGWSIVASLARRGPRGFLRERGRRLLVPFAVGTLLLCPFLRYAEVLHGTFMRPDGTIAVFTPIPSFIEWLPSFFTFRGFSWAHLWFLVYLFVLSIAWLPLFVLLLHSERAPRSVGRAWLYAPIVPLALIQVTMRDRWPGVQNLYDDWANVLFYSLFLVLGFLVARYPTFERSLHREWKPLGAVGLMASAVMILGWSEVVVVPLAVERALSGAAAWGCVGGLLGFGRRYLTGGAEVFAYLRESAYPIYVLHSPAIVLVAHLVTSRQWPVAAEIVVTLGGAIALTLATYELGIRRFRVTRILFGLKAGPAARPTA